MKNLLASFLLALSAYGGGSSSGAAPAYQPAPAQQKLSGLHAVTVYLLNGRFGQGNTAVRDYLSANLPQIKAVGFNAVYLPLVWADFDPSPLAAPRFYNTQAFSDLAAVVEQLRSNRMRLVVGLDYIGDGFAPDLNGIQPCAWSTTPAVYAAFEQYVAHFLGQMAENATVLYPMVFTEGAEGCGQATQSAAPMVAVQLQATLGSMPTRLPANVRSLFQLGYHDYSIVAKGWGNGVGPVPSPNPYDWISMAAYEVADSGTLDQAAQRFTALYPTVPLIVGEMGNAACPAPATDATQAAANVMDVGWARSRGFGFNLWGWVPGGGVPPLDDCSNPVYGGLAITNPDGSLKPAAQPLSILLQ